MISVAIPRAHLAAAMRIMDSGQLRKAMRSTVGQATRQGLTIVRAEGKAVLNTKAATVNAATTSFTRDEGGRPVGTIRVSQRPLGLFDFTGTRATKRRGVTARPRKDRPAFTLRHAFAARMKSGHRGVYQRARALGPKGWNLTTPTGRKRKWGALTESGYAARLPIEEVKPLSVYQVVRKPDVMRRATDKIAGAMTRIFLNQYSRFGLQRPASVN